MADKKISQLDSASTPLAGSEVLPIVQSGSTVKVSIDNLTAGKAISATRFSLSGNVSASAWTTSGVGLTTVARTLTDTSSSGTVAAAYTNVFGGNTIAASNGTTFTDYASLYVATPVAGTNVAITNPFSLITQGAARFDGNVTLNAGAANGIGYLNANKIVTTGSALTFNGTNFATTGTASATKFIPTGGTATGNGMYLPSANVLGWSTNGALKMRLDASGNYELSLALGAAGTPPAQTGLNVFGGTGVTDSGVPGVVTIGANSNAVSSGEVVGRVQFYSNDASTNLRGVVGKIDCLATGNFSGTAPTALTFHTNTGVAGTLAEAMRIDANANVIQGTAAVATTATNGFLWITSCAGAPTGAPTAPYSNAAALVCDTTNDRLYVRVGATWRYATLT